MGSNGVSRAAGGIPPVALVILGLLWWNGSFDHFLANLGLADFARGPCIQTIAGQWFCGEDEVARWCHLFALRIPENLAFCRAYW